MASSHRAINFLDFVNASPSPYHAVQSAAKELQQAGFTHVDERDDWNSIVRPGGKYYFMRNLSSVIAFAVGSRWKPGNPIAMIGTHTDSPCLRVKPVSKSAAAGFLQVGVETYGGGKWHTWFDRDLSMAGFVVVKDEGSFTRKLVKIDRPILRIPTLAIHLDRSPVFNPNLEVELKPILGLDTVSSDQIDPSKPALAEGHIKDTLQSMFEPLPKLTQRHHSKLIQLLAQELGVEPESIVDFDMVLYDTHKSCLGGLDDEFIFSPRLDNLSSTYCGIMGLVESVASPSSLVEDHGIRLVACFDHEECGSKSAQGAASNLLPTVMQRLSCLPPLCPEHPSKTYIEDDPNSLDAATIYHKTTSASFLVSADMAHSVHPNYEIKYEGNHRPQMNKGPVLKINSKQLYTTASPGVVLLQEVARAAKVPLQLFVVRNDVSCGSTIGPMLSAALGVRAVDIGSPQLSMHSIRETGGTFDIDYSTRLFREYFSSYAAMASTFSQL